MSAEKKTNLNLKLVFSSGMFAWILTFYFDDQISNLSYFPPATFSVDLV